MHFFLKFNSRTALHMAWGPQKGILLRGFIRGQMDLQLRPWTFIEKTPTWCTFLSLSFNVHYHGKLFGRHLWPLMASKNEKYHVLVFFFSLNFSNFTSDMDYTLLQDLKKVHCLWESLEARWSSTGGHNISLNVPLNDVPF